MATSDRGNRRFDDDATRTSGQHRAAGGNWSESARQVWLAGVGAWSRAQAEGSKLFDGLVQDGVHAEREGSSRSADVREAMDRGAEDVRGFATGTWDRLGQFIEDTVQRSLLRLGVPRREDLEALGRRIDALANELREARAAGVAGPATPARRRSATKSAAKRASPAATTATGATDPGAATRKPPA